MTTASIKRQVDRLGEIKAAISVLETEEQQIVKKLKEYGLGIHSGTLFDANVFESPRDTTDWKGLAYEVGFTTRQKNKYTKSTTVIYCKVTARLSRG
jgi:hypothetical protein